MFVPSVLEGQWWRLGSALFLHFGILHLALNMFGLWVLGPLLEYTLGLRKYLFVYLASGIGSMAVVLALSRTAHPDQFIVGVSGAIMGLVGATGALTLRAWIRDKALIARRKLLGVILILGTQTIFDAMIPQVSMTAHLSGALFGFIATLFCRERHSDTGQALPTRLRTLKTEN